MGRERYVVRLKEEERDQLERLIRGGMNPARKVARARILLKADAAWGIERIVEALDTSAGTVCRTKRRYLEGGLKRALEEDPRPGQPAKLDERGEAHLIALACSQAPPGPRPLDPEAPGKQGGGVGVGALHVPRGDSQAVEKKLSQAVAEERVVCPPGERRVCGVYGGRAGPLRGTLRPRSPGGLLRRDLQAVAGREEVSDSSQAGKTGAIRL